MRLAFLYDYVGDVILSADVIAFKTERADFSRRTKGLSGVAKHRFRYAPDHRAPPVVAYSFSTFKTSAFAMLRIASASAKSS